MSVSRTILPREIQISRWEVNEQKVFKDAKYLLAWAQNEDEAWPAEANLPKFNNAKSAWQRQQSYFRQLASHAQMLVEKLEASGLDAEVRESAVRGFYNGANGIINAISNGDVITTDHPDFAHIKALAQDDVEAAGLLLVSACNNSASYLNDAFSNQVIRKLIVRRALIPAERSPSYVAPLKTYTNELAGLKNRLQQELGAHEQINLDWTSALSDRSAEFTGAEERRNKAWGDFLSDTANQWDAAIKIYSEKMALAAPVTYWRGRGSAHGKNAIAYASSFALVIGTGLFLFIQYGIPYLHSIAQNKDVSILVAALPVLVPAFAGVWLLRMLGRLLSENIQLMQNASERATMVQTFLALMNDEVHGKSLVTDNDRLLILHSLFRPSSVSASDDSPPVNWFDILSRKLGGGKPG